MQLISSIVNFFLYGGIVLLGVGLYQYNVSGLASGLERSFGAISLIVVCLLAKGVIYLIRKVWAGLGAASSGQSGQDFKNFVSGGNEKLAAERMADMFFRHRGDYVAAFNEQCMRMASTVDRANNSDFISLIQDNSVPNLSELVVLDLHAFAAPSGTPLMYTKADFGAKIAQYLRDRGVPEKFISGDNRELTFAI